MSSTNQLLTLGAIGGLAYFALRPRPKRASADAAAAPRAWSPRLGRRLPGRADQPQRVPPSDNPVICAAWKTGNAKPIWGEAEQATIFDAASRAIAVHGADWGTLPEAKVLAFETTKTAIADVCPSIPLPADRAELDGEYPTAAFWWKRIWDAFYSAVWGQLTSGGSNP